MKTTNNLSNNSKINSDFPTEDDDFHIGIVIKHVRKEKHMSQAEVSDGICNIKYLRALEKGTSNPTTHMITMLSDRLNVDLYNYYTSIREYGDIETFDIISKINKSLREIDVQLTEKLVEQYSNVPKFQHGRPFQKMCHFKALIQFYNYHNYEETIRYSVQGIEYFHKDFDISNLKIDNLNIDELAMLNAIGMAYGSMNEIERAYKIFTYLLDYSKKKIEAYKFASTLNRNKVALLCFSYTNSITCLNMFGRYEEALELANEGINMLIELKHSSKIHMIYLQRMVAAYNLEDEELVKKSYNYCMMFYHMFYDKEFLNELQNVLEEYPGIIKIVENLEKIW